MFSCLALASESLFPVLVTYSNIGRQLSGLQDNHIAGQKKGDGDGRVPISAQWSLWAGAKDNRVASKAGWDSCSGRELQRQRRGVREREKKRQGILKSMYASALQDSQREGGKKEEENRSRGGTGLVVKREERKREEVNKWGAVGRKYCGRVTESKVAGLI